jgi:hypothetical protein
LTLSPDRLRTFVLVEPASRNLVRERFLMLGKLVHRLSFSRWPPAVYPHVMTHVARTRVRRPRFQAVALGLAASVALGFPVQSCGVPASKDCTEKASCPSDGPDGDTVDLDVAVATEAVDSAAAKLSAADAGRLVAEDASVVDVAVDRSVLDGVSDNGTLEDMETPPGEAGDVVVAPDAQGAGDASGAEGAGGDAASADAVDSAIVDAGRDAPSPLCAAGQCPAACAAASVILQIPRLRGTSGSFGTADSACVLFHGSVSGWGVSNCGGRTVTAIGATTFGPTSTSMLKTTPAIAPSVDGFVYWVFTPGTQSYASMFIF